MNCRPTVFFVLAIINGALSLSVCGSKHDHERMGKRPRLAFKVDPEP
jgi:hypothetical protein